MALRRSRSRGALGALVLAGAAACSPPVASVGHRSVHNVEPARVSGEYAPAGQRFAARLDAPIDTQENTRDEGFTARLESPLTSGDGRLIAPAGALVRGRVRSLGSATSPRVRLEFETVETVRGPARLQAAVRGAEYDRYRGPVVYVPSPSWTAYDDGSATRGLGGGYGGWGPTGGGPISGYTDYAPYRPNEVRLPRGARLELVLTRPLLPPGSTLAPR